MEFDLGPRLGDHPLDVLKHVLADSPCGLALEFGVASGQTLALIAQNAEWTVGFDSFEGLPETWRPGFEKGRFAQAPPEVPGNAELVIGLFEETLPTFFFERMQPEDFSSLDLIHVDCDLYSSTKTILDNLGPILSYLENSLTIVFDEFHGYDGFEDHEWKAFGEFLEETGLTYEPIGHGPEQFAVRLS